MSVPAATPAANASIVTPSDDRAPTCTVANCAIRATISHRQSWLGRLVCGWPSPDPLVRLRKRSINYYLRRAAAPSANQRRRTKRKGTLLRPENVKDLRCCRWNVALSLVFLALSITFIVCYCLMPALRTNLGSYEGLACSVSVVTMFVAATILAVNAVEVWHIHRNARRYASFVMAMVDEKGNFNIKANDDSDYTAYIKALKLDVLVILQREYYDWFIYGKPPVRQISADYVPASATE